MCDKLLYLTRKFFPSDCIRGECFIHQGFRNSEGEIRQGNDRLSTRCDVLICSLRQKKTDAIIHVKLGDTDANTYGFDPLGKLLDYWKNKNKGQHGKHFHEQWKHFSQFFLSVEVKLGNKALVVIGNLSQLMAAKIDEPILHVHG